MSDKKYTVDFDQLPEIGAIAPFDERAEKIINLEDYKNLPSFKDTIIAVLEKIIEYNSKYVNDKDRAYRLTYYVRTAHTVYQPTFERFNDNKTILIISVYGEPLRRENMLELVDVDQIIGLGSDEFHMGEYDEIEKFHSAMPDLHQENLRKILDMTANWNKNIMDDYTRVSTFYRDLEEINKINNYNRLEFFRVKRTYIRNFLQFVEAKLLPNAKLDGTVTIDQLKKIKEKIKYKSQDLNF